MNVPVDAPPPAAEPSSAAGNSSSSTTSSATGRSAASACAYEAAGGGQLLCECPPTQPLSSVDQIVEDAPNSVASNPITFGRAASPKLAELVKIVALYTQPEPSPALSHSADTK